MNNASNDLPAHLATLKERMLHPTDYELGVHYFLEEFAGDTAFHNQCVPDPAQHLLAVLNVVTSRAMGHQVTFDASSVFRLPDKNFFHGSAAVEGRALLFFYFEAANSGIAASIPGINGAMEVARFRLPEGLRNPQKN
jgi:hypothetical protein